ncbi:magnesium chelatase [Streptomyces krungchingensis]|uniref:magnesium chelatase n=1 Tax=Streptomyces krungchingensis TaxID=1565034 RepID=UPI003CF4DC95
MSIDQPNRRRPAAAPGEPDHLARRLVRALACSVVDPALAGVLLFDLDPWLVEPVARAFAELLGDPDGSSATPVMLGADSRDEDMWTRPVLRQGHEGIVFTMEPGPLLGPEDQGAVPPLVVVPDLARLSVAGMRAAVQILEADVAVVEQTGLRRTSRPLARWLAVCRSVDAGRLSPHLLDRFAIRMPVAGLRLPGDDRGAAALSYARPAALGAPGTPAVWAAVTDEAVGHVLELLDPDTSNRRALSLLRLARALATLDGERATTPDHCEAAARLIGLSVPQPAEGADTDSGLSQPSAIPSPSDPGLHRDARDRTDHDGPRRFESTTEQLLEPEPAEGIGGAPGGALRESMSPYAEDDAVPLRDFAPLHNPWQRTVGPSSTRGVVVGTQRARDLRDLAYVRTAREAAVHQRVRRSERFTVSPVDLYGNVRAAAPERLLILLLDHTCRGDWDWQDALAPFLQWAYIGRAAVQVIEVGNAEAKDELRAESFAARNVLDPRILAALYRPAGRATPLAHGIEQARQALLRAFRQRGNGLVEVWLAVLTDGRGNVPLRASRTGQLEGPVGTEGVEDAFKAAARFRTMDRTRLHVAVVDAARRPYEHLPFRLADRLGGTVVEGRLAEERDTSENGGRGEG